MTALSEREKIQKLVENLPSEATIEEAMERLYLLYKVEKGLQQADAGQTIPHEEAKKRLKKWLE